MSTENCGDARHHEEEDRLMEKHVNQNYVPNSNMRLVALVSYIFG
jgi:hypothetical protein